MPTRHARRLLAPLLAVALAVSACGVTTPSASGSANPATPSATASGGPPSVEPSGPPPSETPASTGAPANPLGDQRLNVLLIGVDNTTEREPSELTDSLIVASLDPVAGTVSLLGLPRDLSDFPLPDGSLFRLKLNSLYFEIRANPGRFGGSDGEEPYAILARVIGDVVDLPLEHWAVVDMDGFAAMIDELGGVDVYVGEAVCDPSYHQLGVRGFEAPVGWWHMTGPQALGHARVRKNAGGSDFHRMRRQQDLLISIRNAVVAAGAETDPMSWLSRIPRIRTDLTADQIVGAAAILAPMNPQRIQSRLIQPFGNGGTEITDSRGYVLSANLDEIREISGLLFTEPGVRPSTGRPQPPPEKPSDVPALPSFNGC